MVVDSEVTAERYLYDGQHVVLDFYQPDGGDFELAHRYLYGPSIDQILAQENVAPEGVAVSISAAGRVYWLHTDNLGTVRDILDHDGNIVEHYRYDAFGNLAEGDDTLTRYLYTAREYDPVTGLQ